VRLSLPLPEDHTTHPTSMLTVSHDGTRIAYFAAGQLYVRNLGETDARPVPGTAERLTVTDPAFSPDGQWLAYVQVVTPSGPYAVKRVPVSGGAPVAVYNAATPAEYPRGLSWPEPDTLLFANQQGVVRLPANGGAAEVLVPQGADESLHSPQLLPGGESVLLTRTQRLAGTVGAYDQGQIVVAAIGGEDRRIVWQGGSAARYVPSGHLLFVQGNALFAIAFDADARAVRGGPVPIVQRLRRPPNSTLTDAANYAVSDAGTLALIPRTDNAADDATPRIETTLTWVDRTGREEPLPVRPDDYTLARISPDGTRIALVIGGALGRVNSPPAIWIYDLRTENLSLLATEPAVNDGPVWSADGRRIFFRAVVLGDGEVVGGNVHSIELETGEIALLAESATGFPITMPWALVPGSDTLAVINAMSVQDVNLATLSLASREFARLLEGAGNQSEPSFSPDGAWVAYSDTPVDGTPEINIRPFPAVSRTRIPVGRGQHPVFSRDGTELFFIDGEGIAVAEVSYEPTLRVGAPRRLLTSASYYWGQYGRAWDLDPSGQRFLMIRTPAAAAAVPTTGDVEPAERPRIDVVVNWLTELAARVPSGDR
jgi:serine/threonine-protein kinase